MTDRLAAPLGQRILDVLRDSTDENLPEVLAMLALDAEERAEAYRALSQAALHYAAEIARDHDRIRAAYRRLIGQRREEYRARLAHRGAAA